MTPSDVLRVREARRRLREVIPERSRADTAIRIIELESPRPDGVPLLLHPEFSVIGGLSAGAYAEVLATIDALQQNTATIGLDGTVVVSGELFSLHDPTIPTLAANVDIVLDDSDVDVAWADHDELRELVSAAESAVLVTSAELRGADSIAEELRSGQEDVPEVIDLRTTDADREEIRQTLEALDELEPNTDAVDDLTDRLARLSASPSPTSLQATVEQYSAALARVQPTDADFVRRNLEEALDDAVEAQNAYERERRTQLFGIVDVLATIGVTAEPDTAVELAERVLAERSELASIRARLVEKLANPAVRIRHVHESPELADVERRTANLQRKLTTQRYILTFARLIYATSDGRAAGPSTINEAIGPVGDHRRALPIALVEPLDDLPAHLGAAVLSILLRLSEQHQVICLSDHEPVHDWASDLGGRVGLVDVSGWFAGRPEP